MTIRLQTAEVHVEQGGKFWQPFGEGKKGHKNFRQARIYLFRDKCVVFAQNSPPWCGEMPLDLFQQSAREPEPSQFPQPTCSWKRDGEPVKPEPYVYFLLLRKMFWFVSFSML